MTALPPDAAVDLERENARLHAELRAARDRQDASAEILHTIASVSGDAEQSLQRIAEITARLFDAPSVTIQIAEGDGWSHTIRFGDNAKRVGATVPVDQLRIGGKNMPGMIVAEDRQIHVPDLDNVDPAYADWPGLAPSRAAGTRTMAGTPLRREGKAIGVMIVYLNRLAPFTDEELALQQNFADQAAIAIENARLFKESREALERQTATADILKVIASSPSDTAPVFEAIASSTKRLLGGFTAAVFRVLDGTVHLAAYTPTNPTADEALRADFPSPVENFEAFRRAQHGRPFSIPDTEEVSHAPVREIARLHGFRSMLWVPMVNGGVTIGIISVTRVESGAFAPNHIQLLQTFADQAVIAIENARLFNETKEALEQQKASADILSVISNSVADTQPVFDEILRSIEHLFGSDERFIYLAGEDGLLHVGAAHGRHADRVRALYPVPLKGTVSEVAFRERRLITYADVFNDPDVPSGVREIAHRIGYNYAMALAPMLWEGRAIGSIFVGRTSMKPFSEKECSLLRTFADQAVIAIQNARMFNETNEALERQTATADILKVIASSPSDVQPVFEAIATSSKQLLGGFSATVFRFVDGVVNLAAYTPVSPAADKVLLSSFPRPAANLPFFELAKRGEVVQEPDSEINPDAVMRELARARGFRSSLFSPLMSKGTPIGLIVVTRKEPGTFADHHVQLLQTFADQAVIAIENVRLFDEVQARTRDLSESLQQQTATADVLKVISRSAFDLQTVLDTLVNSASTLCSADQGMLLLLEGGVLKPLSYFGPHSDKFEFRKSLAAAPHRGTLSGRTVLDGQIAHVADVLVDPEFTNNPWQQLTGFRGMLAVPLMREGQPIGAMALSRTAPGLFADRQIELVTTFADQAVIAISNVRLFDEVQARTTELAASLDELRTAQDRLVQTEKLASLGQLTAGIAHEIKNPLNFVNNFSSLSAELTDELNDVLKSAELSDKIREEVDELTGLLKDNLQKVVQHGKRADSIVKNMLLHSREGSGEHRPADINALLDESINLAYHGARAEKPQFNVTLQRDFDEKAGIIEVFPQEITRVFLNLISNGFYAVAKRKTENGDAAFEPVVRATTRNLGDRVEIRIRDNGTGIPAEVKEKMFNPFFTTKPAGEGTGLGLSMSHDIIVKQHGGTIDVETEPEQFTEFTIVLPRASSLQNKKRGQA